MRKQIWGLLFLTATLLGLTRPQRYISYLPFINREAASETGCRGHVLGVIYEDINGDSRRGDNEVGLRGVHVMLQSHICCDAMTVVTNPNGYYQMALRPGRYQLHASKPTGYRWTTPHTWGIDIVCSNIHVDFGLEPSSSQR